MFAIILDENNYIKSYSSKFKTPGSILVETMPVESDPEKLGCYQYIKKKFVFDAENGRQSKQHAQKQKQNEQKMNGSVESMKK